MPDQASNENWVLLKLACEQTGLTKCALREYIKKGRLQSNIHYVKREDRIWIEMGALYRWVRTGT